MVGCLAKRCVCSVLLGDSLVGICVERSIGMVQSFYGINKAGGGYVGLDPNWPKDRLAWMVKDGAIRVILTQDNLKDFVNEVVRLAQEAEEVRGCFVFL